MTHNTSLLKFTGYINSLFLDKVRLGFFQGVFPNSTSFLPFVSLMQLLLSSATETLGYECTPSKDAGGASRYIIKTCKNVNEEIFSHILIILIVKVSRPPHINCIVWILTIRNCSIN